MPLKLNSAGGGSVTINAASTGSTVVLTAPGLNANLVTTGDTGSITQSMIGSGMYAGYGPTFSAYNSAGQTVGTGAYTKIVMDTEQFDAGSCYNNTSGTVTLNGLSVPSYSFCPNVAGYYNVGAFITAYGSPAQTGECQATIYKNGVIYSMLSDTNSSTWGVGGGSITLYLNGTGDYVGFYILLGASSGGFMGKGSSTGSFWANMVRAA